MNNIADFQCKTRDCFYIKFYPGIKSSLGCEKATLILGRLEYWFEKYTTGFYKFVEPCSHPLYREGDSWSEELGFPRKVFAKAFDLIGVRYKSKSTFLKAKDKFQGKLYASYHDRKSNQTYFVRNHDFASQFIKGLFKRKTSSSLYKQTKPQVRKLTSSSTNPLRTSSRSRKGKNVRSSGGTIGGKDYIPIQRITSSLKQPLQANLSSFFDPSQRKVTEDMIKIWKEEVGELGIASLSVRFLEKLFESLKSFFGQSLSSWQEYCRMISSSKFLMGEAQNKFFKKAWISWAIKGETIERIRGGEFKLRDRETKTETQAKSHRHKIEVLENKKRNIEEKIEDIKKDISRERLKQVRERIKHLLPEETQRFKEEFEGSLDLENNFLTQEFKRLGWKGLGIKTYFHFFLEEKMGQLLFSIPLENEVKQAIEQAGLPKELCIVNGEIKKLKQIRLSFREEERFNNINHFSI